MEFYIVEDGKLVKYRRTGKCLQCGECCRKTISFQWTIAKASEADGRIVDDDGEPVPALEDEGHWTGWDGYSVIWALGVYWYFKVTEVTEVVPTCEKFVDGLCTAHEDIFERPAICPFWPVHPKDLEHFPKCGYSFERVEERK